MPSSPRQIRPTLAVPAIVLPPSSIDQATLIGCVGKMYAPLLQLHPGDEDYQRGFVRPVQAGLRNCAALSVERHPMHLTLAEMTTPRGLGSRNHQAVQAFHAYVPAAAKQALASARTAPEDIRAVIVETSTVLAMPVLAHDIAAAAGLRPDTEVIPVWGTGCNGGAHAIARARDYVLAHGQAVLVIAADFASPWFYVEPELRGSELRGAIVSSALFSDAAAAAVMTPTPAGAPGFEITAAASIRVPGTHDALAWRVTDDGLHFRLTDQAMKLVPHVVPALTALLDGQGWRPADLAVCSFHTGGDRIIKNLQDGLGLSGQQVRPTQMSLRQGNLISAAVLHTLHLIGTGPGLQPPPGGRGLGAGFGPGFASDAFTWTYHSLV